MNVNIEILKILKKKKIRFEEKGTVTGDGSSRLKDQNRKKQGSLYVCA